MNINSHPSNFTQINDQFSYNTSQVLGEGSYATVYRGFNS